MASGREHRASSRRDSYIIDRSVTAASRFNQLRAAARANPTRDGQTEQLCLAAKLLGGHSLRAGRDTVL